MLVRRRSLKDFLIQRIFIDTLGSTAGITRRFFSCVVGVTRSFVHLGGISMSMYIHIYFFYMHVRVMLFSIGLSCFITPANILAHVHVCFFAWLCTR